MNSNKKLLGRTARILLPWICSCAWAQTPPAPPEPVLPQVEPPRREKLLPELPTPVPPPELQLPPFIPVPGETRLPVMPTVFVRKFELTGNTVFSAEELRREVTAAYENREISSQELQEVRHKLSLYYINRGYINSGAVIPDQKVIDGVIHIKIIEGSLTRIEVGGNKWLRTDYISDRLALGAGQPLNVDSLQQRMLLLQQEPLIKRINAELTPGVQAGEAVLNTRVEENSVQRLAINFSNNRAPSVGSERAEIYGAFMSLTGHNDPVSLRYGITGGLKDFGIGYALPVSTGDTTVGLRADRTDTTVIEAPFDVLNIKSKTDTLALTLNHPVYRTPAQEFSLGVAVERRRSETFLLGSPFSFSPGVQNGVSTVSAVRFSQEWLKRSQTEVIGGRSRFSLGVNAFGATINNIGPDSRFLSWLGQFQWARRLGEGGVQAVFRTDVQLAREALLPVEKFAVGGAYSVRGYRENQFVRDNGLVTSLEFRIPVARLPIAGVSRENEGQLELAPFVDVGAAWNKGEDRDDISSVGLGLRWSATSSLYAQLYWGYALRNIQKTGKHNLQDDGIHFLVGWQTF